MINEISEKRPKTKNFLMKSTSNHYIPPQTNNYDKIYLNKSPNYYNQLDYLKEHQSPYIRQIQYMHRARSPDNYFKEGEDLGKTMKNLKVKPNYYFTELNDNNNSIEQDKKFVKRAVNTFTNKSPKESGDKYYIIDNNHKINMNKPLNGKILAYRQYNHQSYQGEKYSKKFYNSFIQTSDYIHDMKLDKNEILSKPVAQKICNITIKGESNMENTKIFENSKKRQKNPNYIKNNIDIEENITQNSAIPDKNINFNISPTKMKLSSSSVNYNEDEDYNNEENENEEIEEIEEKEEGITISNRRNINEMNRDPRDRGRIDETKIYRRKKIIEREINNNDEGYEDDEEMNRETKIKNLYDINKRIEYGQYGRDNQEEVEIEEDGDLEQEQEQEIEEGDLQEQELEDEQIDQGEQIEQLEDDDVEENNIIENNNEKIIENENEEESTNRLNKGEIEELEEEDQQQTQNIINMNSDNNNNVINKKMDFIMQKEDNIKIEGENKIITTKENIENNEHTENIGTIQELDNEILKHKSSDIVFDIIKDNLEFLGEKKFKILQINNETNIEYTKKEKENEPLITIQKVDSIEQPKVINQKIYKKQILQIIKNEENNVDIMNTKEEEENENQPAFEIQNVESFEQQKQIVKIIKKRKKNKNVQLEISKIKDNDFILENSDNDNKNEEDTELQIENVLFYQQSPVKKPQNKKRNKLYNLKIDRDIESKFEIIGEPTNIICFEIDHIIPNTYNKKIYKKSNYKKYKISQRSTYNYNSIPVINDIISYPEELSFMIKGKPPKIAKKIRNVIKREIIYYYKTPIQNNNSQLSIENNIVNTINPNNNYITNLNKNNEIKYKIRSDNRKMSSSSIPNSTVSSTSNNKDNIFNLSINPRINKLDNNDENKEEKKYERHRTYKTKNIIPTSLLKSESEPIKQEHISIRRKYTNSKSNKNLVIEQPNYINNNNDNIDNNNKIISINKYNRFTAGSPDYNLQSPNSASKENIIKKDYNTNIGRTKKLNYLSPKRDEEMNNNKENITESIINNKTNNNNNNIDNIDNINKYDNNNHIDNIDNINNNDIISNINNNNNNDNNNNINNNNNNNHNNNNIIIGRYNIGISKYEQYNKSNLNNLNKSEKNILGKTKPCIPTKNDNKKEVINTPLSKENKNYYKTEYLTNNNNNNNKNKSHTITIFSNKQEPKNIGRTYISSQKLSQAHIIKQKSEKRLIDNKENKSYIFVNTTNIKNTHKNDQNDKKESKYKSTIYFSSNLEGDNNEIKNTRKNLRNNRSYYTSSYSSKKANYKTSINNKSYLNLKESSKNINNTTIEIDNTNNVTKDKNEDKDTESLSNIKNKLLNKENLFLSKEDKNLDLPELSKIADINKNDENIDDRINNIIDDKIEDLNDKEILNIQKSENISIEKDDLNSINNENYLKYNNNFMPNYDPIKSPKYTNNDIEDISKNILEQYNIVKKPEMSDFTKNYINSYIPEPSTTSSRPALSYFSKQFLSSELNSDNNKRPELSNITRAYLISQKSMNINDDDK